jgi:hypothetical protein
MTLDYSALNQPVTQADIAAFRAVKTKPQNKAAAIIVFALLGIVGFISVVTLVVGAFIHGAFNSSAPLTLSVMAIAIFFVVIATRAQLKRRAKLYKFAVANGLQFIYDTANPGYPGMIFDEGDSRTIQEALLFKDGTEIGNYQYSTGSGKSRQTHSWSYVRIKLTRRLPNMVLDSRKNNFLGSNLPDTFSRGQTLSLEGDFNNYFTLYAPKEYERDALYVFTPDVMAAVVDAGQAYDMEVVDDNLMLYMPGLVALNSEIKLKMLLGIVEKIGSELRDQSHYYADERVGDRAMNIVAEPGRRLKSGVGIGAIVAFAIFILYFVSIFFLR